MPSTVPETSPREPQEAETAPTVDLQTDQQQNSAPAPPDEPTVETDTAGREPDVHHDDGGEVMEDKEDTVIY